MRTYIYADKFSASGEKNTGYLEITDGLFGEYLSGKPAGEVTIIDQSGKWIAPGLVATYSWVYESTMLWIMTQKESKLCQKVCYLVGGNCLLPTTLTSSKKRLRDGRDDRKNVP